MVTLTPRKEPNPKRFQQAQEARLQQTLLFALASAVNGSMVGVTGPAMQALSKSTALSEAELGRVVLFNRIAKLIGSFAWTAYAKALQEGRAPSIAKPILATCSATIAAAAFAIATLRHSALVLQVALMVAGFAYGVSDSAITLLTVWSHRQPTQQRTHVAVLNVGFTCGALISPAVVAAALHLGNSCYVGFYALALCAILISPSLLIEAQPVEPPPPEGNPPSMGARCVDGQSSSVAGNWRSLVMVSTMSIILFCVTGCEHAVATWLPSYGQHVGSLGAPPSAPRTASAHDSRFFSRLSDTGEVALMSAGFWMMICLGRVLWALISAACVPLLT